MCSYKVTFIDHVGRSHEVEAQPDQTLMQAAVDNLVPGIYGDCGGFCTCATCHCYVDEAWLDKLPPSGDEERSMLEGNSYLKENSRLTCQIRMNETLEGIVLTIPEDQY